MDAPFLKMFRRRKSLSRNERAEKYSSKFDLRSEFSQGLAPRVALVGIFVATSLFLLPPTQPAKEVVFEAGDVADRDIIAPFNFKVPFTQEELKVARAQAALTALPVYRRDRQVERNLERDLAAVLDTLSAIIDNDTLSREERTSMMSSWLPGVTRNVLAAVASPQNFKSLNKAARDYQQAVFDRGLIDYGTPIRRNGYREITVIDGSAEQTRSVGDVLDQGRLDQVIREEALARFGNHRDRALVFFELVRSQLQPNLVFDGDETNRRREASMARVKDYFDVSKNERIIAKHDKVTNEQERILTALESTRADQEAAQSPLAMFGLYVAEALRLLLFCIVFGGYLYVFHRDIYRDIAMVVAVFTVMLMYLVFMAVVVRFALSPVLVPVAFASVMLAALFDSRVGFIVTAFAAVLVPLVTEIPADVAFLGLVAGAAGVVGIEKMRARAQVYSVFLNISAAYVVGVLAIELGRAESASQVTSMAMWGIVNGMFSSAAVLFLLPVFENLFGRTSRFTLLELTDLNKPILKRLNMEAHGTYHHSMLIGNLVAAVADLVGADALKVRVMAYYHDIGKMFKPEYFAENQDGAFNKHEKITPQMSALILVSHVKDGVELAKEEKLPQLIIDGIREHHGTSVMAYFYQKALETDSHSSVNKDDFRYPGPRPRTKETGLLMCADTVEAAVRSLKDPTPASVRNMVTKLIDLRAQEGELDESGITLNDLNVIKDKFISILTGIYHKRVAYPGQEEESVPRESVAKSV
jgi:putative nucleotidyltransferase with HDIG domain